jgi:hypothetical protein
MLGGSECIQYNTIQYNTIWPPKHMHTLVGLHDTVGSVRPRRDNKAVQYSLSYTIQSNFGFRTLCWQLLFPLELPSTSSLPMLTVGPWRLLAVLFFLSAIIVRPYVFVSVGVITAPVAPMWWISQMSSFGLMLIQICLTLSPTLLVIWAVVILMLSWLRSPK